MATLNHPTCFYCSRFPADPNLVHKVTLYRKLDSELGLGLTGIKRTTRYLEKTFLIDRCVTCHEEHYKSNKPAFRTGVVVAVLSGIVTYFFALRIYIAVITGLILGFIGMLVYIGSVYRKRINNLGIKDKEDIRSYPPVRELLDNGWETFRL